MTGTRRKPRAWNTDMQLVNADEVIYHDYTDEHCTDLCMIKFKTTLDRIPLWIAAHKSAFKDAVWETEVPAKTVMMKAEIEGKSLTIKFCESSGVMAAQGPQGTSRWKNSHLQELKSNVNSLEALNNQSSFDITDVTESQHLTSQRCANESITAISPIAKTDAIAQVRNSFVSVVSDSSDRIARSKRSDARSRTLASSFLGEVDWPNSTVKGPMKLSRSLPVLHRSTQTEEEPEERVETEAPLITSTPIGVRHLQRDPFVPSTPSLTSTRYLSTLGEADDTIQERSLTEQQEVETVPTTPINTQERSLTTQDTASSPITASDVTLSPMERNLSQEPPTVASETFTHPNPQPQQHTQIPDVRFPPPYSAIVEREAFEKATSEKLNQLSAMVLDLQNQLNTRDNGIAQQMELVTTLLKAQAELHCPSPTPEADDDKHLLLGSSLIQLVDESQLKNTEVICKRGAHPNRLSGVLKVKAKAGEKFESVSLLVGGNKLNRSNPTSNISATADAIMETAECAKAISKKVRIIELPPRLTSDAMVGAIQGLNREVQDRCSAHGYEFVPTSGYFWLANGTPNRALIDPKDKVHPTELGAEMLLLSIGVQLSDPDDPRKGVKPKEMRPPPPPKQSANENAAPIPPKGQKPKRQGKGKDRVPNPKAPSGPKQQGGPPMGGQTRFFSHASQGKQNTWQNPPKSAAAARKRERAPPQMSHTPERSPPPAWSPNGRSAGAHMQGPWGRSTPTPQGSAWSTQERSPAERCQLCLNAGHSAPACRSQSQPCYRCGKPGHFSRACPY